ncbi:MAG TPA: hypothetical protein PLP62_13430 [Flavobacteriaceae bacterium]|nr:hypothetical protein [Flavobacteriaceae bacterium]HPF12451.1 hypothetical protein [Flavobacteriaceae bacterium]HQU66209.1 hypothetical protein [Flavobacteriaceae bacterium]
MEHLAPIVLFVYNRPWHTAQTLEALSKNTLANQSIIYIFSDGAKEGASGEDISKINQVRSLLLEKQWCKEVNIVHRDQNLGLANNVIDGVTQVINKHGKVIVLEDDILTGKYFLKFMNDGLNIYREELKVFGISGYKFPSKGTVDSESYFLPLSSSWSYATWFDRWNDVSFNGDELLIKIDNLNLKEKLNFGHYPFYRMLVDQVKGLNNSWAIRFYSSMLLKESYFLFPKTSLVENIGFDNTGVHCGAENSFSNVKLSNFEIKVAKQRVCLKKGIVSKFQEGFLQESNLKKGNGVKRIKQLMKGLIRKNFNF